jgi:UDP-glucose 4-epimerase
LRVLLTGGFGYLGRRLAQTLEMNAEHIVTLATRRAIAPPLAAPHANAIRIDWDSEADLRRACDGMEAVVHLAGMNTADCANNPVAALEFNGVGTARLIRAAILQRVKRFIYLSTAHVYGAALKGVVDEHTCPEPRHPYATSHRAGEDAVRSAHEARAIDGIVVRLSNSFGAPVDPDADCWSLLTNDLCRQAVNTRRAVLRSDGIQRRDFVPISEACRAIAHLLTTQSSGLGDGVFNVGSGWVPTIIEMAELVATRVEAVLRFRPHIQKGSCTDAIGSGPLDFRSERLLATGFEPRRGAIVEELDRLIAFCAQQAQMIPP